MRGEQFVGWFVLITGILFVVLADSSVVTRRGKKTLVKWYQISAFIGGLLAIIRQRFQLCI